MYSDTLKEARGVAGNFDFLAERFPVLARFGRLAEQYWQVDANACLMKLGMLGETVVTLIYDLDHIARPVPDDAMHRIQRLRYEGCIDQEIAGILHTLRKKRNLAVHEGLDSVEDARVLLPLAYTLVEWFYETYGDYQYEHRPFVLPEALAAPVAAQANALRQARTDAERQAEAASDARAAAGAAASSQAVPASRTERQQQAARAASHRHRTEAETRLAIDAQLRSVGWEADTVNLKYARGTRPQKGRNLAIAEWPTAHGWADYMLFCGLELVGVVEAKAAHKDIPAVLDGQARDYARTVREADAAYTPRHYRDYAVPFIFATNGRPYLAQYAEKSGIWFQDLRDPMNLPRALHGWISPDGIRDLLAAQAAVAQTALRATPYDELTDKDGLNLRPYQVAAVQAAEDAVAAGQRSILLAMATGTGKTRTVLALIYRFLKTGRFRRILFLVDRNVLGAQAEDAFREVRLGELHTLTEIYNVQGLEAPAELARETRVQVATVQSLVRRILYHETLEGEDGREAPMPAVTDFDLVIIDEAHRGYLLDRDMTDAELCYRDQRDYLSKYRSVVEYFDAVRIALTATPALHTTEIFGAPVYTYSYREAVIDGYLVDHDAPVRIETELGTAGIHYDPGDRAVLYDPDTDELLNGAQLPDELDFDLGDFNTKVITEGFNRAVLGEIARQFDPSDRQQGKMLIFAANDQHADLIVRLLREHYADIVPPEAIRKITGTIENGNPKKIREAVLRFKNEQYPSIVVTVDLLTTGVDVPEITTLVFLRRVKSRILFEQMLGRATRLCPAIHKEAFTIYDAVGTYDVLAPVSSMKPVAAQVHTTLGKLLDALEEATAHSQPAGQGEGSAPAPANAPVGTSLNTPAPAPASAAPRHLRAVVEETLARLQRKAQLLTPEDARDLREALGTDVRTFLEGLHAADPETAAARLVAHRASLEPLERLRSPRQPIVIDGRDDHVTGVTTINPETISSEDYLAAFTQWIAANRDHVEALRLACTSPRDLTYTELKHLRKELAAHQFTERQLTAAYQSRAGEGLAGVVADIISLIRRATLGTPLLSHAERIHRAVERLVRELRTRPDFSKAQENVLHQIEQYFLTDENYVVHPQIFDEDTRFQSTGGRRRYDKIFGGRLTAVIDQLNTYLYDETNPDTDGGKSA